MWQTAGSKFELRSPDFDYVYCNKGRISAAYLKYLTGRLLPARPLLPVLGLSLTKPSISEAKDLCSPFTESLLKSCTFTRCSSQRPSEAAPHAYYLPWQSVSWLGLEILDPPRAFYGGKALFLTKSILLPRVFKPATSSLDDEHNG